MTQSAKLSKLEEIIHQFTAQIPYLIRTVKLVWVASGWWSILWMSLLVVQGVMPAIIVYMMAPLVDGITDAINQANGWQGITDILPIIIAIIILMVFIEVSNSIMKWIRTIQTELITEHVYDKIHAKALSLDMSFFDSSKYYDKLHRARIDAMTRPLALLENIGHFLRNGITLVAMLFILYPYAWWLPLLLIGGTLPVLFVVIRHTIRFHVWRKSNTAKVRKTLYYDWLITQQSTAAEIRLFKLGTYFKNRFSSLRKMMRIEHIQLIRNEVKSEVLVVLLGLIIVATAMGWMLLQAVEGKASMGDLVLFYQAFNQAQKMMRLLLRDMGEIYKNIIFLENLFEFFDMKSTLRVTQIKSSKPISQHKQIQFDNVSFKYPNTERWALRHFSITIPIGKTIAIVGTNGAGKSTLIKLLNRFYDPQEGTIKLDDTDFKDFSPEALHQQTTVLFQEPIKYAATATENITLGNLSIESSQEDIEKAAYQGGADSPISRLKNSYQTMLGRHFGGEELSTGEWQRIALSRAFFRKAPFIILDEPTSAMDSWAEFDWLKRFMELSKDKTSLVITHRFTTAMKADIIYLMDQGEIIESGTHESLMELNGKYATSWKQQMNVNS
jgi:ATP-binding cassette subfamily B protein